MLTIDKLQSITIWDDISECREVCEINNRNDGDWTYQMDMLYTTDKTRCRIRVLDENNKFMGYL